jgi:uncharacterized lipoprotein YddW (UPF0748 family)
VTKVRFLFLALLLAGCIPAHAQTKTSSPAPIRGVWLTNVASQAMDSRENLRTAVKLCAESGINNIYVVTWNRARTLYPSQVMQREFGVPIMERFAGRDPLQELIEEAHKKNIKVHAWFEFGFASSYQEDGGEILRKYPQWKAIDRDGNLVKKNGFEWMNAFHPEVQDFVLSLVMEVVRKYNVDGIQGDDRLPANPSTAGYDEYTVGLYKQAHQGQAPPHDYKNPDWLTFRSDILNRYMERIYKEVKAARPKMLVTMAPSIFPWSREEYLQDWPTWVKNGWVDYIFPQVYRYKLDAYTKTLEDNLKFMPEGQQDKFYPGVLLKVDDYTPTPEMLSDMVKVNRKLGVKGEVYFFYEGLKLHSDFFKKRYGKM